MRMSRIEKSVVGFCLALTVMVLLTSGALAQSTTDGAIGGTVTDSSGAAVPNAKVMVKNNGTNAEETVMTDDTGYFRVGKLQPGEYTVSVEAQGFGPFKAQQVIVQVGSVTDIPARLNVASAGATVVVSAEVPQVNTNSQEFAQRQALVHLRAFHPRGGAGRQFRPGELSRSVGTAE